MKLEEGTAYQRVTVSIGVADDLTDVFGPQIRKGLTVDGLYDDPLAHNHAADGKTIDRAPSVLFRKGNKRTIILVGIGEGAAYLRDHALPLGKEIILNKAGGGRMTTTITSCSVTQNVDRIALGGMHHYRTCSPIIIAKSDPGNTSFGRLLEAEGVERERLIAKAIARSIRRQMSDMEGVSILDVPHIHVVIKSSRERVIPLKSKVSGFTFHGEFAANVIYSGGRYGVGIGRNTSAGYGIVEVVRG